MILNDGEVLHFARTVLIINAENSLLQLEVAVMTGVTIIWCHLSTDVAARRETKLP